MQTIPVSSIHYSVAQKKIIEYQHNLNYAHKMQILVKNNPGFLSKNTSI
jgi:hypothetical protein